MPELTIKSLPTPPANATAANSLNQGDAAGIAGDHGKPAANEGAAPTFAAVLKSQVGQKPAATASEGGPAASEARTDIENIAPAPDLSAILTLLGSNVTDRQASPTNTIDGQPETEATTAQTLATLLQPQMQDTPTSIPVAPYSPPAPILDSAPAKQPPGANSTLATSIAASPEVARAAAAEHTPGKPGPDPAIAAGGNQAKTDGRAIESFGKEFRALTEIPASDLTALMQRTAHMGSAATDRAGGPPQIPALRVETPMGLPTWHDEVGQRLTWMVGNNRQQADLVLTPPQLGRIEVSLTMNGDQASAIFTSPNPAVREALEGSLQRLREVLADAGVSLGQTQVGSESPNQSRQREDRDSGTNNGVRYLGGGALPGPRAIADASGGRGMIDIFA